MQSDGKNFVKRTSLKEGRDQDNPCMTTKTSAAANGHLNSDNTLL